MSLEQAARFTAWADRPDLPPENVAAMAALSQAHATMALVEQQRAATIVALWSMETGPKITFLRDAGLTPESGAEAAREAAKILGLS